MKKILIVSDYLDKIWWIETYIWDLKKVLEKNWFKVELFWVEKISKIKKFTGLFLSFINIPWQKKIKKKLDEFQPNLVWFHSVSRFLWPNVIKEVVNKNIKTIMTYHDLWYFAPFANKVYDFSDIPEKFSLSWFIEKTPKKNFLLIPYIVFKYLKLKKLRKQLQKVDYHTAPSEFVRKLIVKHNYAQEKQTQILPNFILKEQIAQRQEIYQDKINFVFFWRLEREKWVWLIIYFLAYLWDLKYINKELFNKITKGIRIFIFWDGSQKKQLLETFTWKNIYWEDISFVKNLENHSLEKFDFIDSWNQFVYYFWRRDFETIKKFLSFSHFNLVPSLFLETFGLSAAQWCANKLINIWFNKPNINSFILDEYKIDSHNYSEDFTQKMLSIIEWFSKEKFLEDSKKSYKLVEKLII